MTAALLSGFFGGLLGYLVTNFGVRRGWPVWKCIAIALALWCVARAGAILVAMHE